MNYIKYVFKDIDIELKIISHAKRFPKIYALTETLENMNHKNFLISHGTHTVQKVNSIDEIGANQLALGLLFSNNPKTILCSQSIFADDFLRKKGLPFVQIIPLQNIRKHKLKISNNPYINENKLKILHACTIKQAGMRRYTYHSSGEYITSILKICNKLKKHREIIKFVIRVQSRENEISINFLKYILKDYLDFIEFSKTNSFIEELNNIDCLIALSSTTIEEAIVNNIPAISLGETGYDHLKFYNNYNIPTDHPKYRTLQKIEELLDKKFIYLRDTKRKNSILFEHLLDEINY